MTAALPVNLLASRDSARMDRPRLQAIADMALG